MRLKTGFLLAALLLFASFCIAAARIYAAPTAPGDLDTSFGGQYPFPKPGLIQTPLSPSKDVGYASVIQPNGRMLVAGTSSQDGRTVIVVARFLPNGSLDGSFNTTGWRALSDPDGSGDVVAAMALQSDGKIVVAGYSVHAGRGRDLALWRLTNGGAIDSTFSGNPGNFINPFPATLDDEATAVAIQPDGKIVVAGAVATASDGPRLLLARFEASGRTDYEFGIEGFTQLDPNGAQASALLLTGSRIVVGGYHGADFVLVGFTALGNLDTHFGTNGYTYTDFYGRGGEVHALLQQAGGKIVAAGTAGPATGSGLEFALARYSADGVLDSTFGTQGKTTTDFSTNQYNAYDIAYALLQQSSGKLVAVGTTGYNGGGDLQEYPARTDFALARYSADGALDTTFGTGGKVTTAIYEATDSAYAGALAAGDKILAVGTTYHNEDLDYALVRYSPDGALDTTFDADGKATADFNLNDDYLTGMAIQPNGKIVTVGATYTSTGQDSAILRYNADGTVDGRFGYFGRVIANLGSPGAIVSAAGVALQNDGKIVVAGHAPGQVTVLRLLDTGDPDPAFGTSGYAAASSGLNPTANAVALQPDGKIVVAGYTATLSGRRTIMLARFTASGVIDNGFGTNGFVSKEVGQDSAANAVAVSSGGKIVVAGVARLNAAGSDDFAVLRFNANGTPDSTFGGDGVVTTDMEAWEEASSLALLPGDKILVAGASTNGVAAAKADSVSADYSYAALAEYRVNGQLETAFGGDGIVREGFGGTDARGYGVAALADGRFALTGSRNGVMVLALLQADGQLSPDFGGGGYVSASAPGAHPEGYGVAVARQGSDKFVVGGVTRSQVDSARLTVARFVAPTSPPPACAVSFSDVPPSNPFYGPIYFLACNSTLSGYADGTFRVGNNTTRGQLAKIVVNAAGWAIDTTGGPHFRDVPASNPFYGQIETAINRGILSGYNSADRCGAGQTPCYRPNDNVTRGQLAKIIVNASGWTLVNPARPTFTDVTATNAFYKEIETAVQHGVISGYDVAGGREFRWGNPATRGQIAKIVYLAITYLTE